MPKTYAPPIGSQLKVIAETLHRGDGLMNARGEVPGQSTEFKFGYQGAISNTEVPIWDVVEAYTYLSAAKLMTVSSDNPADDAAGTGARTVQIFGLDANYVEINETVTLVSTTAVTTTQAFLRVFRMQVLTAGSGEENAGVVYTGASTVAAGVPSEKYAAISAGENQSLMAIWTVPAGKTAFMRRLTACTGATAADLGVLLRLKIRKFGELFQTKDKMNLVRQQILLEHVIPKAITEKSDVMVTAIRTGNSDLAVCATIELFLRDD